MSRKKRGFYADVKCFILQVSEKLIEKCLLKFKYTRAVSCLLPILMATNSKIAVSRAESLFQMLFAVSRAEDGHISSDVADKSKKEYKDLLLEKEFLKAAKDFLISDRVDVFFKQDVKNNSDIHKHLKLILILSNEKGASKKGFSINQSIIINGMKERTVIAHRTVHGWILLSGKRLSRDTWTYV